LTNFVCGGTELKDVILDDLKKAIAKRYPEHVESTEDDELQRELDRQDEFVYTSGEGFVEQEGAFAELDRYLASGSRQTFVLTAPGGMGKSTLLANWVARQKKQLNDDSTLHYRFIGQSDQSGTVTGLLRYLLLELQQVAGKIPLVTEETAADADGNERTREIPFDIPQVTSRVQEIWREQLECIGSRGKTIFVIDALNELDSGLKDVAWLSVHGLPEGIQLIVSFRDDAAGAASLLKKLAARTEHVRLSQVKPFGDLKDRRQLVNAYLAHFLKELESRHLEEIVALRGASNPLFLKVVLSELECCGGWRMTQRIQQSRHRSAFPCSSGFWPMPVKGSRPGNWRHFWFRPFLLSGRRRPWKWPLTQFMSFSGRCARFCRVVAIDWTSFTKASGTRC
jgi:hypothetical protein